MGCASALVTTTAHAMKANRPIARRQGNERGKPMEEVAGFLGDVRGVAGPHRNRQQHDVHGRETRDGQTFQQPLRTAGLLLLDEAGLERMSAVAEPAEFLHDRRRPDRAIAPFDRQPVIGIVQSRVHDAVETLQSILDLIDACGAVDAFDGQAALDTAVSFAPEVVLLDIGLPVMDGYEVAQRMRRRSSQAPIKLIALTGYGQEHDRARALAAGFDVHLVKPVDLQRILEAMGRAEDRARSPANDGTAWMVTGDPQ